MTVSNITRDELTVANRYLADQLSEPERAAFETELCENPAVLRELEATARFKLGLAKLRETGELDELLHPKPWYRQPLLRAAAAGLAILLVGILIVRVARLDAEAPLLAASVRSLSHENVLAVGATVVIFRNRSDIVDATVELPAVPQAIELRVMPDTASSSGRYRATLFRIRADESREPLPEPAEGLVETADGFISVFVDSSRLPAGRYQLDIRAEAGGGAPVATDSFFIRAVPREAD
jgi:hypothetical protein